LLHAVGIDAAGIVRAVRTHLTITASVKVPDKTTD